MPERRIVLSGEAERNISAIHDWLSERSSQGAAHWYTSLFNRRKDLARDAPSFALAPEDPLFDFELRNATFHTRAGKNYRVLFTIGPEEVRVLFVRGPGQDLIAPSDDPTS